MPQTTNTSTVCALEDQPIMLTEICEAWPNLEHAIQTLLTGVESVGLAALIIPIPYQETPFDALVSELVFLVGIELRKMSWAMPLDSERRARLAHIADEIAFSCSAAETTGSIIEYLKPMTLSTDNFTVN